MNWLRAKGSCTSLTAAFDPPSLTVSMAKSVCPCGFDSPNRERFTPSGATRWATVSVPSGWSSTSLPSPACSVTQRL